MFRKGSILWVIFWDGFFFLRKFNFGLIQKRAQFFESYCWKKSSIIWVQCKKRFNSFSQIQKGVQHFESFFVKKFYSLSRIDQKRVQFESCKKVIHMEERFNSSNIFEKKVQFFESYWKTRKVQFFASYWKKDFNSF